jgi:hypothetical protein
MMRQSPPVCAVTPEEWPGTSAGVSGTPASPAPELNARRRPRQTTLMVVRTALKPDDSQVLGEDSGGRW